MIYYDWKRLYMAGNGNPIKIIKIFKDLVNKRRTPETLRVYSAKCDHYILNELAFIRNKYNATADEQCIYLHIASKRNYLVHKLTGKKHIEYVLVKEYELDKLRLNRLLLIEENNINLIYEQ